jgi:chromosome segregation ATPase
LAKLPCPVKKFPAFHRQRVSEEGLSDAITQMREQIRKLQDEKARLEDNMASLAKKRPELDKAILDIQAALRSAKGPSPQLQADLRNAKEAAQGAAAGGQSMRMKIAELSGKIAELDKNIKIVEDFMRPKK